ncbi:MAG: GntR family transcriptional regulator [Ilumatobacteraceae bacterium]
MTNHDDVDPAGAERAYAQIRAAIVEGRYERGQRLVEQRIAAEYSLSRTPVREALRRLDAEGLVIIEKHRGAIVRPMATTEVLDLYGLRIQLESYAAGLAAERITAPELGELRRAVERFGDVQHRLARAGTAADVESGIEAGIEAGTEAGMEAGVDDARRLNAANRPVHDRIVAAAHHHRLTTMLARTVDIPLVFSAFRAFDRSQRERSDIFHHLILEAIGARDATRATALMAEHIRQGRDVVLAHLEVAGA